MERETSAKFSYSIDFLDNSHGVCVGWYGEIHHTSNSGKDWTKAESGTEADLYSVDLLYNDSIGYAVGDKGVCLKTSSGEKAGQPYLPEVLHDFFL
jgi:photosystem II stability/assembly factor-like uncharacterized protein